MLLVTRATPTAASDRFCSPLATHTSSQGRQLQPPPRRPWGAHALKRGHCRGAAAILTRVSSSQSGQAIDDELSKRPLELDPRGYFIIFVDRDARIIIADHYGNTINEKGLACDPRTGEVIPCDGKYTPPPPVRFRGRTAKELAVEVLEKTSPAPVSRLEHAAYLGREFQRAEAALLSGGEYVQD